MERAQHGALYTVSTQLMLAISSVPLQHSIKLPQEKRRHRVPCRPGDGGSLRIVLFESLAIPWYSGSLAVAVSTGGKTNLRKLGACQGAPRRRPLTAPLGVTSWGGDVTLPSALTRPVVWGNVTSYNFIFSLQKAEDRRSLTGVAEVTSDRFKCRSVSAVWGAGVSVPPAGLQVAVA